MDLVTAGMFILLVGFAVVILSTFLGSHGVRVEFKGAGVVMIGPIPIVFGSDAKWASVAIVLAIALILVYFVLWVA